MLFPLLSNSTLSDLSASQSKYGMANCMRSICYFDELMKVYINIKNNSNLCSHQIFNKRIGLMKKERKHNATHRLSFGELFDEKMLKVYCADCHYVILTIHQFIEFSPFNKSAVKTAAQCPPLCPCADTQSCRHNGIEYHTGWRKRKASDSCQHRRGFWGTKAIAH